MKFHKQIKGFSLIELMVAIAILMISMTAILDFIVQYHRINIENTMRNESMRIVEAQLEQFRNTQFSALAAGTFGPTSTPRTIRNIAVNYSVNWTIQTISPSSMAIRVDVTWPYRGITHRHSASTIISTDA
jgi:prepilin-type N-terminal cleavage/methylation domain-containing protein